MPKYILLFVIISLWMTTLQAQNKLVSYQLIHQYSAADINTIIRSYNVPSGALEAQFGVDYYRVHYITSNALGTDTTIASGAIAVPQGITCPMPLMSYQHGTTSKRYEVPSYRGGSEYNIGVIGCATTGSIVSMPDYLGLGDNMGMHPYINARTEASASVDLLRACRELKDSVGYNLNNQLFLFGYSQGGHATMALFREIETNLSTEFTVTAAAPMSGPYHISGVQAQTIIADTPYATPGYLPYVIMGQQAAYGNVYNSLSEIFKSPYDTLLPSYFDGTHSMGWINNRLPDTPNVMLDSAYFQAFKTDPNHFGWTMLRDNDVHNWAPRAQLKMYFCTEDEQVFYQNSLIAEDSMLALGATDVEAVNIWSLNHTDCAPFAFLFGLSFMELHMDLTGGMQVTDVVTDVSNSGATDGSITLNITNATGPYRYEWSNGDTGMTASNLRTGMYEVTIRDSRGCYLTHNTSVGIVSSVAQIDPNHYFKVLPNPVHDVCYIQIKTILEEPYTIAIFDMNGRLVHQTPSTRVAFLPISVEHLVNGTYIVQLQHKQKRYTQQLIISH